MKWRLEAASPTRLLRFGLFEALTTTISWVKLLWGRSGAGTTRSASSLPDIRRWVRAGRALLPEVTADTLDAAQAVRERYVDLHLDLADAVNVAVAAEFRTNTVLTLDRGDFRAIHPLTDHYAFRLLPDDA